jgi:two-component system, NarL family, nitrate/nitrite response regulator NarL
VERVGGGDLDPSTDIEMKVLIVEEQEVVRRGLLAVASSVPDVVASAVATVSPGQEALLAAIDVTLVSTSTLVRVERAGFDVDHLRPMIVILPTSDPQQLEIATRRPADGYIVQGELTPRSLRTALLEVMEGHLTVSGEIAAQLLDRARGHDRARLPQPSHLSSREAEVLTLLVGGASNKEIAQELHISVHGVKRHVSTLLGKFESQNRLHLVSRILRAGMVPPSQSRL